MQTLPPLLKLPPATVSGRGTVDKLPEYGRRFGPRGMLVHGKSLATNPVGKKLLKAFAPENNVCIWQHSGGEPTLQQLDDLLAFARAEKPDWIAGIGGGSVLDLAKAAAGLLYAPGTTLEYHDGFPLPAGCRTAPFIAVPTTAGTGSEATAVCVITNEDSGVKKSFRDDKFIARIIVLDANLLDHCPPPVIAAAGMDAFVQAVESFISRNATDLTTDLSLRAAKLIKNALTEAFAGATGQPRENLLYGSYLAGIALANARLGLVHGLAHPLGARYHLPHGQACALCLPAVLKFNRPAVPEKFAQLEQQLECNLDQLTAEWLTAFNFSNPFSDPRPVFDRTAIIAEILASGSTAANPRTVSARDAAAVLDQIGRPAG